MDIVTRASGNIAIAQLSGRFDAYEVSKVNTWLEEVTRQDPARVIVNLAGVSFVDSSALATLVKGLKRCRQHNGDLLLCSPQQPVKIIFELTRLDRAFRIFSSEDDALKAFA